MNTPPAPPATRIYLDYNASTPIDPRVAAVLGPLLESGFGNPSSLHWAGVPARAAVEQARARVAAFLGCAPDEVVFTSGGSEANNLALKGVYFAHRDRGDHLITTAVEHPAVLEPCRFLERLGARVTYLPVDGTGRIDPDDVRRAITPRTLLVSIMHANNEVGTIQPLEEVSRITRERGVLLHTDAAQSAGKIPTDVGRLRVDLLSLAGHKMYAPKGVGALYVRHGVQLEPLVHGAGHEGGRRAGTESALLVAALGKAAELAHDLAPLAEVRRLRDLLWRLLQGYFGEQIVLHGHPEHRLPNTLNVGFVGRVGGDLLAGLEGVAASTGSACHAGSVELSPVLRAMGVPPELGMGAVRLSLGRWTTEAEVREVAERFAAIARSGPARPARATAARRRPPTARPPWRPRPGPDPPAASDQPPSAARRGRG
jgi:cysteine desulfurase